MALVLRQDADAVAHLTMNAPERLNPLSDAMLAELSDALERVAGDRAVRAVVLSGAGRAFCAGHDLREMTAARQAPDGGAAAFGDLFARCSALMQRITTLPQPVIAQVHGLAAAAGCQLVATCDLAVAARDTRFGVNGVNIGLFCSTPMVALTRSIGAKQAFEMLVTGDFIDAPRAAELGLINRAVPFADLAGATHDYAARIAAKFGGAVKVGKRAFHEQREMSLAEAYAHCGAVMVENMLDAQTAAGIEAFLDKRTPEWTQ